MRPPRNVPTVSTTAGASNTMPVTVTTPRTCSALDHQVRHLLLEEREVRLVLEQRANGAPVELPVRLRARGPHGRALAGIERAELDAGAIRGARHGAAERIDLAHEVALADAAHRRVAAHLPERLDALGEQQRLRAHARGRKRGLGAGVAATDDDDIEWAREAHGWRASGWECGAAYCRGARRGQTDPATATTLLPVDESRLHPRTPLTESAPRTRRAGAIPLGQPTRDHVAPLEGMLRLPPLGPLAHATGRSELALPCPGGPDRRKRTSPRRARPLALPDRGRRALLRADRRVRHARGAGESGRPTRAARSALRVARVPAINRRKAPDPLFLLAGGPGMAATTMYAGTAPAFARIQRNRDIVLRRPARHRQIERCSTARSMTKRCMRSTPAEVAAETQALPRDAQHARGRGVLHDQRRRSGSGPRARSARLRTHQSLRRLVRHARRRALPAPLSGAHARGDSRRRRRARAGTGPGDRARRGERAARASSRAARATRRARSASAIRSHTYRTLRDVACRRSPCR